MQPGGAQHTLVSSTADSLPTGVVERSAVEMNIITYIYTVYVRKVTAPQDAHKAIVLQVFLGSLLVGFRENVT